MQKIISNLAVLLAIVMSAGCMYTINGNPDVNLTNVRISPIAMTLPFLDSGDRAGTLQLIATVTGDGANANLSWVATGVATDSIVSQGQTATYFLARLQGFASTLGTVQATSTSDFSRTSSMTVTYVGPGDVPFIAVPMDVTLLANSAIQFVIDTIHGHTVSNVTWNVTSGPGTVTTGGLYVAPSSLTRDTFATILAQSGTDTSSATIHILQATDSLKCFTRDVEPILATCAGKGCHGGVGGDRAQFTYQETLRNVHPGNARASRLYTIITELNANDRMPPPPATALTPQQIRTIGQWIDEGALDCP